ncbi:type VI secretion system tip protein VgrG (plasmid) [Burkholderia pyrrocinia]|uniref:type VI secretion system Vgr family protein n=1 Tax=Burkholderia pyrrocinia TaxID=60550 RepID=UPI00215A4F40|nr:type VI secretion system tip protein VgrG [Burkholderia pyrrocinia]UVE70132.1 type VI secretion system tip protein VgrG [Burkholderia pyrrocinia]
MGHSTLYQALRLGDAQYNRLVKLDTPLGVDWLLPLYVKGSGRLGRDYEFIVDTVSARGAQIKLDSLIGKAITLWIQQTDGAYMPIHGYVHQFSRTGADGALTYFRLRFSSWLYFLRLRRDMRDWQEKKGDEILTDVFNEHPQARGAFRFELRRPLPNYSNRVQWEHDINFVHRTLEEAGTFCYFEQAPNGRAHTLVLIDDSYNLPELRQPTVQFGRSAIGEEADGFMQWKEQLQIESASLTRRSPDYMRPDLPREVQGDTDIHNALPTDGEIYEYPGSYGWSDSDHGDTQSRIRLEERRSRMRRFHGSGALRCAMPGYRFELQGHPLRDSGQKEEREFVLIGVEWLIRNNLPGMDDVTDVAESLASELLHAKTGATVTHADGSAGFYHVNVEAQRRDVPYRSPLEHAKPAMQLQSAIIAGPANEEVYTDELNRVKVWFFWNRRDERTERASIWVRPSFPDAGDTRGGIHPLRKGDEVVVGFMEGDCDRPVIISRMYGGATKPVWHTNGLLSGFRSKEYGGGGFNQLVMDDSTGQNRVHLYSTSYDTHLHLGYLIQQKDNTRGALLGNGFDLKSTAYGAIRAGRGLYVSSHPAADGQPLAIDQPTDQFSRSQLLIESLSNASTTAQAESLEDGEQALKDFVTATRHALTGGTGTGGRTDGGGTGDANGFSQPVVLIASPAGVAVSTQASAQVSADKQLTLMSGENANVVAGKSLVAAAVEKISLFVQKAGMKLFAAKGKVEIAAQSDAMSLFADRDVTIISNQGRVTIDAKVEIILKCGGSYIRLNAEGIEDGTRGARTIKSAAFCRQGASSVAEHMNSLPKTAFNDPYILHNKITGEALANHPYEIVRGDGTVISGTTDELGRTIVQQSHDVENVQIRILPFPSTGL